MRLYVAFEVVYYGIITQETFGEDKAFRLLNQVKSEVSSMYKGNVEFMLRQSNLERNCLSKFINSKVNKILDSYRSNIKNEKLGQAFEKVDKIKGEANEAIQGMLSNMEDVNKLNELSKDIQFESKEYQKGAATIESNMVKQGRM